MSTLAGHKSEPDTAAAIGGRCGQQQFLQDSRIVRPLERVTPSREEIRLLNSTAVSSAIANLPQMVRTCISVVVIIAVTRVAVRVAVYIITKFFQREAAKGKHADAKRLATLMNILNSAVRYLIYFVGAMTVLERLSVPTSSIVATAGIGGLAIGFGAQNLVRDVITGFLFSWRINTPSAIMCR